ncbi:uncharacterized protein LOC123864860 isoform X2 [Maniola jurtina]|uniref:uncharacterized protein LOC123864860 isoform X2 n=1 Tax=Maniola jurtina TaxID=191418 RepID=UPI001E68D5AD|nr:uncharacterized protein LOC123864860 isoform X2 [Maniola jurtina]
MGFRFSFCKRRTTIQPNMETIVYGRELDLGPYNGKMEIGVLPERYPNMTAEDKKASYSIRRLLELFRESFISGLYGIPALDPYINDNLTHFTVNVPFLTGEVNVAKIIVTGLQAFKIVLIELRLDTIRSDFIFTVPQLNGIVYFQAYLELAGLFPLSVNGTLRVNLQNVTVEGAIGGSEKIFPPKHYYTSKVLQIHFHAEDVKVSVDGLNLERDILESLQSLDSLASSFPQKPIKKVVNYYVAHEILKQLNNIIGNFSVQQVKAYLLDH